jgi:transglutaminase-like putative cysteine protease
MVTKRGNIETFFKNTSWLAIMALFLLVGCQPQAGSATPTGSLSVSVVGQRDYAVHQQLTLVNNGPGKPDMQNLWVALIRSFSPYQKVQSMQVSPGTYTKITDEYGNQYAEFDFSGQPAGTTETVQIDYRVTVYDLAYNLSACQGSLPDDFIQPELHIESANPQIVALAGKLSLGKDTVCQQVRAFYDFIGNTLVYTYNGANWGAQAALGPMGADCTEYTDLLVALSRARRIPARYFDGLLYLDQGTNALAKTVHSWPDVYLASAGWVAMDPTLGRSLVDREMYFGHYTPDHIIVTLGVNPSVLRGGDYWTHLYWPGNSTRIVVSGNWKIELVSK